MSASLELVKIKLHWEYCHLVELLETDRVPFDAESEKWWVFLDGDLEKEPKANFDSTKYGNFILGLCPSSTNLTPHSNEVKESFRVHEVG